MAGIGPTPIRSGNTPAAAVPTTRAMGDKPKRDAAASEATNIAQEPSLIPDAFPAVTVPPSRNGVGNFASASIVEVLILGYDLGRPLRLRNVNRHDLLGEDSGLLGLGSPLLRAKSEFVLRASVDAVSRRDIFSSF